MLALRFAGLLGAAVWFGGLLALGAVAAPAIFDVLRAQAADGSALAGAAFGEVLRRFHFVSYVCGAVIIGSLVARAVLGPRPRRFGLRAGIAVGMLAAALYSGMILTGRIDRLRTTIGGAPSSLPAADPRRAEFARLHLQSMALQAVPLLGGLVLLAFEQLD